LLIGCVFAGPALMGAADVGARLGLQFLLGSAGQMPVGIVTGLTGGPHFLYLMRNQTTMGEV
jgi:iron complex transport system permease protein